MLCRTCLRDHRWCTIIDIACLLNQIRRYHRSLLRGRLSHNCWTSSWCFVWKIACGCLLIAFIVLLASFLSRSWFCKRLTVHKPANRKQVSLKNCFLDLSHKQCLHVMGLVDSRFKNWICCIKVLKNWAKSGKWYGSTQVFADREEVYLDHSLSPMSSRHSGIWSTIAKGIKQRNNING